MKMINQQLQDFKVLPLKWSEESLTITHELFIKEHIVKRQISEEIPAERTLFVVNVPPFLNEDHLKGLFSKCGEITNIVLKSSSERNCGFKFAYVVYKFKKSLLIALKLNSLGPVVPKIKVITGIKKWTQEYNSQAIVDPKELQSEIKSYMAEYDKRAKEKKEEEKRASGVADDEGWITVSSSRRSKKKAPTQEPPVPKKKQKELQNFYTFQIRESKMQKLASLRQKFQQDKMKIQMLKQARKFKPY